MNLYMVVSILEVEELFNEGIYDEETILETIGVKDFLKYFNWKLGNLNDAMIDDINNFYYSLKKIWYPKNIKIKKLII